MESELLGSLVESEGKIQGHVSGGEHHPRLRIVHSRDATRRGHSNDGVVYGNGKMLPPLFPRFGACSGAAPNCSRAKAAVPASIGKNDFPDIKDGTN